MNEQDIDQLLRQGTPEIAVRPGLETRIRASLRAEPAPSRFSLAWIFLPLAALVILLLVLAPEPPVTAPIIVEEVTPPPVIELEPEIVVSPLKNEARALKNEAQRTGRFLLDCFPALTQLN